MTEQEVKDLIRTHIPGAEVNVRDTTGTGDHFSATVVSSKFEGMNLIAQHRMVMAAVAEQIKGTTAPIHALDIKTRVA